jgi:hypothetical protein
MSAPREQRIWTPFPESVSATHGLDALRRRSGRPLSRRMAVAGDEERRGIIAAHAVIVSATKGLDGHPAAHVR